jgi:Ca2+-binding EF-hand superfamily protein
MAETTKESAQWTKSDLVEQWEKVQIKTFTNWVNSHLVKRGTKIDNISTGFQDGINLIQLLEVIADESVGKYEKNPKMRIQKIENIGKGLKFIQNHNVKLANIGPEEICDGNLKMTLGMIWTIILRFAIAGLSEEGLSAKEGLLLWCRRKTEPYSNVDVKDFTLSFQDGLAFCALIHRHRPDLIDYDKLTAEDKLGNLNLAFDVAKEHLDVARLLDAEDIVNMPRPDERSIMTYVAQLYQVFSSLDKVETAGRRVAKFVQFSKTLEELQHDYETRTRALNASVQSKTRSFPGEPLGDNYHEAKDNLGQFNNYKKNERRAWITEQGDLGTLFGNIQAKLKSLNRPAYVPPAGLTLQDVEHNLDGLLQAERERRKALNTNLRNILEAIRKAFAQVANDLHAQLQAVKSSASDLSGDLQSQLSRYQGLRNDLNGLKSKLPEVQAAEQTSNDANIEDNEYTDHTYDDLQFEHEQLSKVVNKKIGIVEAQIQAQKESGSISSEQLQEFKETFNHFDSNKNGRLTKLEFKSCISGLGLIELDFEGGNAIFESIFQRVSDGGDTISFEQFVDYMTSVTVDSVNRDQIQSSFDTLSGGKGFVTENDLKVGQVSAEQIAYLLQTLPPHPTVAGGYDYKAWLATQF